MKREEYKELVRKFTTENKDILNMLRSVAHFWGKTFPQRLKETLQQYHNTAVVVELSGHTNFQFGDGSSTRIWWWGETSLGDRWEVTFANNTAGYEIRFPQLGKSTHILLPFEVRTYIHTIPTKKGVVMLDFENTTLFVDGISGFSPSQSLPTAKFKDKTRHWSIPVKPYLAFRELIVEEEKFVDDICTYVALITNCETKNIWRWIKALAKWIENEANTSLTIAPILQTKGDPKEFPPYPVTVELKKVRIDTEKPNNKFDLHLNIVPLANYHQHTIQTIFPLHYEAWVRKKTDGKIDEYTKTGSCVISIKVTLQYTSVQGRLVLEEYIVEDVFPARDEYQVENPPKHRYFSSIGATAQNQLPPPPEEILSARINLILAEIVEAILGTYFY